MEMISESYRGMSLVVEVTADRILVPFAVVVALIGAALIGVEVTHLLAPTTMNVHQL
jgi:hypothetical protein